MGSLKDDRHTHRMMYINLALSVIALGVVAVAIWMSNRNQNMMIRLIQRNFS